MNEYFSIKKCLSLLYIQVTRIRYNILEEYRSFFILNLLKFKKIQIFFSKNFFFNLELKFVENFRLKNRYNGF